MDNKWVKLGIAFGVLYGIYRFAPGGDVKKAMVLGVAGVLIARNTPIVNQYIGA